MKSVNNRLIITGDPRLHTDNQDGAEIILREANHRGFTFFLFHTFMITPCIFSVNVLYFLQYLEQLNRVRVPQRRTAGKNTTVLATVRAMCCCEGTGIQPTALGSATASRNSTRKSLRPWGTFPREQSRKRRVLLLSKTPKTGVVGHSSLSERHESSNEHGTAQGRTRMDGCALSAFPPPLRGHRVATTLQVLRPPRTEERQKKPRDLNRGGVSQHSCCPPYEVSAESFHRLLSGCDAFFCVKRRPGRGKLCHYAHTSCLAARSSVVDPRFIEGSTLAVARLAVGRLRLHHAHYQLSKIAIFAHRRMRSRNLMQRVDPLNDRLHLPAGQ